MIDTGSEGTSEVMHPRLPGRLLPICLSLLCVGLIACEEPELARCEIQEPKLGLFSVDIGDWPVPNISDFTFELACTVDSVEPAEEGMIETHFTCDDEGVARPLILESGDYHGPIPWTPGETLSIARWEYIPDIDVGSPSWTIAVRDLANEQLLYAGIYRERVRDADIAPFTAEFDEEVCGPINGVDLISIAVTFTLEGESLTLYDGEMETLELPSGERYSIYAAYAYKWDAGESGGGNVLMIQRVN